MKSWLKSLSFVGKVLLIFKIFSWETCRRGAALNAPTVLIICLTSLCLCPAALHGAHSVRLSGLWEIPGQPATHHLTVLCDSHYVTARKLRRQAAVCCCCSDDLDQCNRFHASPVLTWRSQVTRIFNPSDWWWHAMSNWWTLQSWKLISTCLFVLRLYCIHTKNRRFIYQLEWLHRLRHVSVWHPVLSTQEFYFKSVDVSMLRQKP